MPSTLRSLLDLLCFLLDVLSSYSSFVAHPSKDSSLLIQVRRGIEFSYLALVHHNNAIVSYDCTEAVGDAEESSTREGTCHGTLDLLVGLHVYAGGRFVTDDYAGVADQCTRQCQQLSEERLVKFLQSKGRERDGGKGGDVPLSEGEIKTLLLYNTIKRDTARR